MKKRSLYLSTWLLMLLCSIVLMAVPAKAETSGNWSYTLTSGGLVIDKYLGTEKVVDIPAAIDGYKVTAIGKQAFMNNYTMQEVTIPENITSMGPGAFYGCIALAKINYNARDCAWPSVWIYNSDQGYGVFSGAGSAAPDGITVIFGPKVTKVPNQMFHTASWDGIPANVRSIANLDPYGHNGQGYAYVKRIQFSSSITYIGDYAFMSCRDLEEVDFRGSSIQEISAYAFLDCTSLTSVTFNDQLSTIYDYAFAGCSSLKNITWGSGLSSIQRAAFAYCTGMEDLVLSKPLTTLGQSSFAYCTGLKTLDIPSSVTTFQEKVFYGNTGLQKITYRCANASAPGVWTYGGSPGLFCGAGAASPVGLAVSFTSTVKSIPGCLFMTASFNTVPTLADMELDSYGHDGHDYAHVTSVSFASSVQTIYEHAFMSCRDLKTVKIGSGVIDIRAYAFADCSSLTTATMNTALKEIGDHAFSGCNHLTTINWSTALATIGRKSFMNCDAMKTLVLPEGLETIGVLAFARCDSLASVTLPASLTYLGGEAFYGDTKMADLTVKSRNLAVAEGWIYDGNKGAGVFSGAGAASSTGLSVSFTSTVKSIPGGMFMTASFDTVPSNYLSDMNLDAYGHNGHDYAHVTSVSIASSVQTINEHAFMSCRDLKTVKIGSGVINIKAYAFADCSSLTTATMNTSLMDIGDHAFSGCNHLTTLNWSTALEHIGYRSFENCAAMKTLTLPEGLDSVGVQAFAKCDSLASVTLPASLTYLGGEAFYGDHKIATLTVKSKNLTVPDVWIYDGSKGAGVFSGVGSGAVGGLKVTFTSGVTQIPAFFFDTASTSEYGHNGYDYCYVTSVTIPSSVKSIGSCAFRGCRNLKTVTVEAEKPEMGDLVFDQCSASGFTVKCYYAGTVDTYCQTNGIKTAYLTPTQPAISALEVAADSVKVSWSRSKGVKGYYVYRSVNDGAYEKVKTTTLRSYVDEDVVSGGKYRYKIYGYCKDGTTTLKSAASGYKTTYYLSKPATPTASNLSTGVKVSWSKVTGATGYYVYRKIGDGDYKKVKTTTSTSWTDTGAVTSGKKYTYKIYAIYETSGGTVYKSVASSARVYYYLSKPATPTTSNLSTGVKVSWSKVTGATGYYVYRKIGDDAWKKVKTTASTSWTDTGAKTNGKKYAYKLYATYTSSSGTVYQSPVSTSRTIYYLTRPEISSLTSTTAGSLKVAYNKNSTATGYEIVYSTSSSFTTSTKVKVTSASTVSKTISSLTKGKKYYVKVRSYKTVSDKTYYSAYSGYRSVTVKS